MTRRDIAYSRLWNQQISGTRFQTVQEAVSALGAIQAQDYLGALWAIGLRVKKDATEMAVEQAVAERKIIRTWPMRGTLHFVAARDVRWMLQLLTPRIIAAGAGRFERLELDSGVLARCRKLFIRALRDNRQMTRNAMMHLLEKERISTVEMRGYHVLWRLAQEGLLCFAGRQGKQHTFALLEEWAPEAVGLERDAALAELARRYFAGHGPATLQDFVWWTGLKISDAKAAVESVSSQLRREEVEGISYWMAQEMPLNVSVMDALYLLPGFDEYLLGYRDRSVALEPKHAPKAIIDANGTLLSTIVLDGRVVGTWKRVLNRQEVLITARTFAPLSKSRTKSLKAASELYGRFAGRALAI